MFYNLPCYASFNSDSENSNTSPKTPSSLMQKVCDVIDDGDWKWAVEGESLGRREMETIAAMYGGSAWGIESVDNTGHNIMVWFAGKCVHSYKGPSMEKIFLVCCGAPECLGLAKNIGMAQWM